MNHKKNIIFIMSVFCLVSGSLFAKESVISINETKNEAKVFESPQEIEVSDEKFLAAMTLPLKYYGDPILRKISQKVENITDEIRKLVSDMIETMDANNGVGIAAVQVGFLYRLFVIRPVVKTSDGRFVLGEAEVYINPVLSSLSKETDVMTEGCLSIPGIHEEVERPVSIHVEATDLEGNQISETILGFKAREIMHENDHLNGKLFIDRIPEDRKKWIEKDLSELKKRH